MRAWHWLLVLMAALAPFALYAGILVAAAALGYWKAIRNPPTLTMVYVDRAVPSRAPSAPSKSSAAGTSNAPSTPRGTVAAPR
jgi:hypothetical protein